MGSQKSQLESGSGITGWMGEMFGGDLQDLLEMRAESRRRPHRVVCYRDGSETGGLDLKKKRRM